MIDKRVAILQVEDSSADILMTREALDELKADCDLHVVADGAEAMAYLRDKSKLPDLILLDLNLPKKNGREVLAEIKSSDDLKQIPVIVLTTSKAEEDINTVYRLQANCYVIKPVDFNSFLEIIRAIKDFWFDIATLR